MSETIQEVQNKPITQIVYFKYWLRDMFFCMTVKVRLCFCPRASLPQLWSCSEYIQPVGQWGPQALGSLSYFQGITFWFVKVIQILQSSHPEHLSSLVWSTFISTSLYTTILSVFGQDICCDISGIMHHIFHQYWISILMCYMPSSPVECMPCASCFILSFWSSLLCYHNYNETLIGTFDYGIIC